MKNALNDGGDLRSANHGVGAMQDVEEERFQQFRIRPCAESRNTGTARKRGCPRVVKEESELPASSPPGQPVRERARNVLARCVSS